MAKSKKNYAEPIDIKLYVPDIGDKITLEKDWNFSLYEEGRNRDFIKDLQKAGLLDDDTPAYKRYQDFATKYSAKLKTLPKIETFKCCVDGYHYDLNSNLLDRTLMLDIREDLWYTDNYGYVTMPAGCELYVDRIYIRKGASGYSSITFRVEGKTWLPSKSYRFWVKLSDTRGIEGKYQTLIREG